MQIQAFPRSRQQDIVMQDLGKEILLYDLQNHKAFSLNETSSLIWRECDGKKSISQISQLISRKLNKPATDDLVWMAIDDLKKENLLENESEFVSVFDSTSRREMIKKVGLGTMIALPVISSLIAPTSAMAQSVIGECGPVTPCPPGLECCIFNAPLPPPPGGGPVGPSVLQSFCFDPGDGECGTTN